MRGIPPPLVRLLEKGPRTPEELNRLGDEGWELVSITSINFKTGATDHIGMVFKREKQTS